MEALSQLEEEVPVSGPTLVPIGAHAGRPEVPLYRMTVIGAHESMHLRLVSPQVSRAHAVVLNCDGGVFLHDLNSRDGVRVNGRPVADSELAEGDVVTVGPFSFRLEMKDGPHEHRVRRKPRPVRLELAEGEPMPLDRRVLVIGRRQGCDLRLKDPLVATVHAAILNANGRHYIRDLGSHNGTLVNGRPVRHVKLRPGDVIRIGECTLRYVRLDGEAAAGIWDEPVAEGSVFAAAGPEVVEIAEEPLGTVAEATVEPQMLEIAEPEPEGEPGEVEAMASAPAEPVEPMVLAEPEEVSNAVAEPVVPADPEAAEDQTPAYAGPFEGVSSVVEMPANAEAGVIEGPVELFDGAAVDWPEMARLLDGPELMGVATCGGPAIPADDPELFEVPELADLEITAGLEPAPPAEADAMTIVGAAPVPLLPREMDEAGDDWADGASWLTGPELVLDPPAAIDLEAQGTGVMELPELAQVELFDEEPEPAGQPEPADDADDEVLPGVPASALPVPDEVEEAEPAAADARESVGEAEVELDGIVHGGPFDAAVPVEVVAAALAFKVDAGDLGEGTWNEALPAPELVVGDVTRPAMEAEAVELPGLAFLVTELDEQPAAPQVPAAAAPMPVKAPEAAVPAAQAASNVGGDLADDELPQLSKMIALAFSSRPMTGGGAEMRARGDWAATPAAAPTPARWRRTPVLVGLGGLLATAAAVAWLLLKGHL